MKSIVVAMSVVFLVGCGGSSSEPTTPSDVSGNTQAQSSTGQNPENTQTFTSSPYFNKLGENGVALDDDVTSWKITEEVSEGIMIQAKTVTTWAKLYTFKEAKAYCENLNYAGFDDWRLPNSTEALYIMELASHSSVEMQYFPHYFSDSYVDANSWKQYSYLFATRINDNNRSTVVRVREYVPDKRISVYETNNAMVKKEHIKYIHEQLQKLNSKVPYELEKSEKDHALCNVLSLACGGGTFSVSLEEINNIKNEEFSIQCNCEKAVTRQR